MSTIHFEPGAVELLLGRVLCARKTFEGGPVRRGSIIPLRTGAIGPAHVGDAISLFQWASARAGSRKGMHTSTSRKAAKFVECSSEKRQFCTCSSTSSASGQAEARAYGEASSAFEELLCTTSRASSCAAAEGSVTYGTERSPSNGRTLRKETTTRDVTSGHSN